MKNSSLSKDQSGGQGKNNTRKLKETFREAKNDSAVKDALKKEKQPSTPDDLSYIHNTREIGTTGGDQRASESEAGLTGTASEAGENKRMTPVKDVSTKKIKQ